MKFIRPAFIKVATCAMVVGFGVSGCTTGSTEQLQAQQEYNDLLRTVEDTAHDEVRHHMQQFSGRAIDLTSVCRPDLNLVSYLAVVVSLPTKAKKRQCAELAVEAEMRRQEVFDPRTPYSERIKQLDAEIKSYRDQQQ